MRKDKINFRTYKGHGNYKNTGDDHLNVIRNSNERSKRPLHNKIRP
ncbi:MAG: hypothetical protein H7A30_07680 [Thermotogae bacterium]|nr:hypothetical protein [Thermotogota bacterium]